MSTPEYGAGPTRFIPPEPGASAPVSPAAWHPDPLTRHELRYWDGRQWTEHVADAGVAGTNPLHAAAAPARRVVDRAEKLRIAAGTLAVLGTFGGFGYLIATSDSIETQDNRARVEVRRATQVVEDCLVRTGDPSRCDSDAGVLDGTGIRDPTVTTDRRTYKVVTRSASGQRFYIDGRIADLLGDEPPEPEGDLQ